MVINKINDLAGRIKSESTEILFVFPSYTLPDLRNFIIDYHSGVSYILAYLKERGIHGLHFIHKESIDLDTLTKKILQQETGIIGFTCFDSNYYLIKLISQRLKKYRPELIVVLGGPTATFSSELIMQDNPAIDICVRGEGEATAYELIKQLKIKGPLNDIKGITYRMNGKLVKNADRPFIMSGEKGEELDIIPSPYLSGVIPAGEQCGITTSRGCIFKCIYCNFSAMSRWTVRFHSVERVISELKKIDQDLQGKDKKREVLSINDDVFSLNPVRAKQLCRRIIEEKINLRFWCETRADKVDKELLKLMYKAGIRTLNFGLESAVPHVLKTIKKVRDISCQDTGLGPEKRFVEKVKSNVRFARKIGIKVSVSIILGLPGATMEDDKKTLNFVRQLKIDTYYHNALAIYAGTEIFKTFRKYGLGIVESLTLLPYHVKSHYNIYNIPMLSNALQNITMKARIREIMRIMIGDYENKKARNGYPDLLFINTSLNAKLVEWLKTTVAICPTMLFSGYGSFKDASSQEIFKEIVLSLYLLPGPSIYLFDPLNIGDFNQSHIGFKSGKYSLMLASAKLRNLNKRLADLSFFDFVPFANFNKKSFAALGRKKCEGERGVIFTLSTLADVKKLAELFSHSEKIILEADKVKLNCDFLDECRWSQAECPAKGFSRAIIDENGSIRICFNAVPIAKVGDERIKIINKLSLLWDNTKKERGCDSCCVKKSCSKCLFPYPFTVKEYCRIRRGNTSGINIKSINKAIKLFKLMRGIRIVDEKMRQKHKFDRMIVWINDNGMNIVDIGKRRYFSHDRIDEFSYKDIR